MVAIPNLSFFYLFFGLSFRRDFSCDSRGTTFSKKHWCARKVNGWLWQNNIPNHITWW